MCIRDRDKSAQGARGHQARCQRNNGPHGSPVRPSVPAIATEVLPMSPTGAAKFTAATLPRLTAHPIERRPGRDDRAVQAGSTSEDAPARDPRSPRSAAPARANRSWRVDPHPYTSLYEGGSKRHDRFTRAGAADRGDRGSLAGASSLVEPAWTALSSRPGRRSMGCAVRRGRVAAVNLAAPVGDMGNTSVAIAGTEGLTGDP